MRNSRKSTRIIALIMSIFMLFSCLPSLSVFVSAADDSVGANYQGKVSVSIPGATNNSALFGNVGMSVVKNRPSTYVVTEGAKKTTDMEEWGTFHGIEAGASFLVDCDIENKKYQQTGDNHFMCDARDFALNKKAPDGSDEKYTDENGNQGTVVGKYQINGEYAVDIVHDLEKTEAITKIMVSHHTTPELRSSHYYVYASVEKDDLFKKENIVKKIEYNYRGLTQSFDFSGTVNARYVAIRVFNPYWTNNEDELQAHGVTKNANQSYIRMFEFNVFGAAGDKVEARDYPYTIRNVAYDHNEALAEKNSLIINKAPSAMFFGKSGGANRYDAIAGLSGKETTSAVFTDGDATTAAEIYGKNNASHTFIENSALLDDESKMFFQINYKFDGEASVSDLQLTTHKSDDIAASHIKVSVAATENALFDKNAAGTYISGDIYSAFGSVLNVGLKGAPKGLYIGVRIICPVKKYYDNAANYYVRLFEVSAYGTYESRVGNVICNNYIESADITRPSNVEITYTGNPDSEGNYTAGTVAKIKADASMRDYSENLHSFRYWKYGKESSKPIIGNDIVLEIPLEAATTTIYAIYGQPLKTVTVNFQDYWGNPIHTAIVPFGQYIPRSDYEIANSKLENVPGKELVYSDFRFGSREASMPTWNKDIYNYPVEVDGVTFTPMYVTSEKTYTVTLNGVSIDGNIAEEIRFDQKIELTDLAADYWTVNDVVWCKGSTFTAYVTEDMEIETKTGSSTEVISLAQNPVISGSSAGFAGKLMLPDSAIIEECGLLLVAGDSAVTDINLSNAQQKIVARKRSGNEFMITVNKLPKRAERRARMYVKYRTSSGASQTTSYSNIVPLKMP